ncbi:NAD(P)-binding protein [Chondromyces crocatus]|uniref:Phytoene dehydrogenase n=1 Tax=Chondromyces crocatus TaxID=52 RepID=A0A0K1E5H9_CHOCO|nr:NAD(P)-binding protein [Chondromyces crocatus]AKT36125.1 phytoene dehydrogenase [Chondromyces crocatus]
MIQRHYDVIVIGRSIGALTAAALLARRDFTVMVVGHGERPPSYRMEGRRLRRRAFTMLAEPSPAWRKVMVELAQSQTWKRRVTPAMPMMQALAPRLRLDIPPDMALFGREIDRELPELRRVIDELYADLAQVNSAADEAFERDAVWPPGTFWERRETGRYAAMLPYAHAEPDADLMVEFPRGHLYRAIVTSSVMFATDLSALPPPFAVARLHGAWTRGVMTLPGGEEDLEEFLIERVQAHGGVCLLDERAAAIHVRRGVASGVLVDGAEQPTSAGFVITDLDGEDMASLSGGEGIHKRALREWPRITSSVGRFVVSLVVRDEGLPAPLGPEAFVLPGPGGGIARPGGRTTGEVRAASRPPPAMGGGVRGVRPGPLRPAIHLQRCALPTSPGESLLIAEVLLPDRGQLGLRDARQVVLDALTAELPFLERHLLLVDSPHDGLPAWVYEDGRRRLVERGNVKGAEPMMRQLEVDPPGYLGLSGEPIRGPIERTLLVGRTVLPALGQEGQLLAAWGAARLVTRTDRRRERMRRDMWSKVEIG